MSNSVSRLELAKVSCRHHVWLQSTESQPLGYLAQVRDRPEIRHVSLVQSGLLQQRSHSTLFQWWWNLKHASDECSLILRSVVPYDIWRLGRYRTYQWLRRIASSRHGSCRLSVQWLSVINWNCVSAIFFSLSEKKRLNSSHSLDASCEVIAGGLSCECNHRRRNRGGGARAPWLFCLGPNRTVAPTFEKCRPIFESKVTPYFQS